MCHHLTNIYTEALGNRIHFLSADGGATWVHTSNDIVISKVDTGITRFSAIRSGDDENRIILSGPIGDPVGTNRRNLGLWSSTDEGVTFETPFQLVEGVSAYSDIITLSDSINDIYNLNLIFC